MKIRYGNGQMAETITFCHSETSMRVAIRGTDDALELRRVGATWVAEDGEVVIDGNSRRLSGCITEEDCICPPDLAARLLDLLYTDSSEDVEEAPCALARPA
jgi:hypothetical protein